MVETNGIYRLMPMDLSGNDFGYLFPIGTERVEVCDDECSVGRYRLVYPNPRTFAWSGGMLGDVAAASGPTATKRDVLEFLRSLDASLGSEAFRVVPPETDDGRIVEESYRLLRPERQVDLLPESTIKGSIVCPKCGRTGPVQVLGVERVRSEFVDGEWQSVTEASRQLGAGMHVSREALAGAKLFAFREMVFCTDPIRQAIQERGFTNVAFHDYGELR